MGKEHKRKEKKKKESGAGSQCNDCIKVN